MHILVTGANGFIGIRLCQFLVEKYGHQVRRAVRKDDGQPNTVEMDEATSFDRLTEYLKGIDCVIHLAARVHVIEQISPAEELAYQAVNVDWSERLAKAANENGVRRFVFVSSIGVCGNDSEAHPYAESGEPAPKTLYATSKLRAEEAIGMLQADGAMEVVIVRPTLVYGEGVKANFRTLLLAARRGLPVPFASLSNRRSFTYLENLVSALSVCVMHPNAAAQTFHVCDGTSFSLKELFTILSTAMGRSPRMFACPVWIFHTAGSVLRCRERVRSLTNNLEVDSTKIRKLLHWTPPYTGAQGLAETAKWFDHKFK